MANIKNKNAPSAIKENMDESVVFADDEEEELEEEELELEADSTTLEAHLDRRDEVGEVRKMSSKDTNRLRWWRLVVMGVLLLTAFAVTFTTYTLLK